MANATQIVLVRNPYYWKVDTQGQQHPYIDKLVYTVFQDAPAVLLKATNGEIDFKMRHFNTLANKPVLYDNQKKGDCHFFDLTDAGVTKAAVGSGCGWGFTRTSAIEILMVPAIATSPS